MIGPGLGIELHAVGLLRGDVDGQLHRVVEQGEVGEQSVALHGGDPVLAKDLVAQAVANGLARRRDLTHLFFELLVARGRQLTLLELLQLVVEVVLPLEQRGLLHDPPCLRGTQRRSQTVGGQRPLAQASQVGL